MRTTTHLDVPFAAVLVVVVLVVSLVGGVNGSSDLPFINVHVVAHSHCDPGKSILMIKIE